MANNKRKKFIDNDLQDFLFDDNSNISKPASKPVARSAKTPSSAKPVSSRPVNQQPARTGTVSKRSAQEAARAKQEATKAREMEQLRAQIEAELKVKQATEAKAKREAALKAKQEAEAKAKQAAALKAKQDAEAKAKQAAALKAKQETEAKAKQAAALKAKQDAEAKAKRIEELKARQAAELKAKQEAEAKAKLEAELKVKQEAEAKAKRIEELKARQAELKAKQEAEAKRKRLEELKAIKEARAKQEAEAKAKRIEELKAIREARAKQEAFKAKKASPSPANTAMPDGFLEEFFTRRDASEIKRENEINQARMLEELKSQIDTPASRPTQVIESKDIKPENKNNKAGKKSSKARTDRDGKKGLKYIFDNIPEDRNFIQKILLPKHKPVTIKDKVLLGVRYMALCCALMVFMAFSFTVYAIATAPKIDPVNIYDQIAQSSTIYDQNGDEVCTVDAGQDRTIVQYEDLPDNLVNAVVALEDKTFWKHHGFNWVRICGAILQAFTNGGDISGTSTITQQLARNVYLPEIKSERSMKRKIIEMYYSAKIERTLSKEYIFAAYMNSIYFGFGNYGVESAAETYFSKSVSDLTLVECATLASLPQSPDAYAPLEYMSAEAMSGENTSIINVDGTDYIVNDIAKSRRSICLQLMNAQGYITDSELLENSNYALKDYINPTIKEDDSSVASYFKEFAIDQVADDLEEKYSISREEAINMIYCGGLSIYTTMDREAQESIEHAFEEDSYFPGYTNLSKNDQGDVVTESGDISLYNAEHYFSSNGNFILKKGEFKVNDDGSLEITGHKRLYFYETEIESGIDWSIEFKPFYEIKDDKMYIHQGGYLNIPSEFKTIDENDNITVSAEFMKDNEKYLHPSKDGDGFVIESDIFTVEPGVVQPQAAMVIVEVGTGELKAMVGGRGIKGSNLYNRATGTRQPGSSLKPLAVYSAALQKSFEYAEKGEKFEYTDYHIDKQGTSKYGDYLTAASIVTDEPTKIEGKIWPTNATGTYSGNITMRRALQMSVNVSAVKLYLQVGKEYSADMVEKFGITTLERSGEYSDLNPSGLGMGGLSNGVSALEMAQAYTTFPNGGSRNTTIAYTKVVDRSGDTILTSESESIKVLDEGVAFIMTDMLKSVVTKGIAGNAKVSGVEVGGKTGTTSSNYDIWFDGFTPHYAAALWIGSDVNITLTSDSSSAARLWSHVMSNIPAAKEGKYPDMPSDVVKYKGEYFTKGTETGKIDAETDDGPVENPRPDTSDGSNKIDPNTQDQEEETPDDPDNGGGSGNTPDNPDPGGDPGGGSEGGDTPDTPTDDPTPGEDPALPPENPDGQSNG